MSNLLSNLFQFLVQFFGETVGIAIKRAPLMSAFFAISVLTIATYLTAMHSLIAAIDVTVPSVVVQVWGWFMPSNVTVLLSALYGAKIAKWSHLKFMDAMREKIRSVTR